MSSTVENITERPLAEEIAESWLTYAVAVVSSRAIPSVYDGMKPVVRRCVYSAYDGGYRSNKKTVKSARIVGDCFVEGTLVSTPQGLAPIETLEVGDTVIDVNGDSHAVVECYMNPPAETVEVKWVNGHTMRVTPGQKFQVVDDNYNIKWVEARDLKGCQTLSQGPRAATALEFEHPDASASLQAYVQGLLVAEGSRLDWRNSADGRAQINMCAPEPLELVKEWANSKGLQFATREIQPKEAGRKLQHHLRITSTHPTILEATAERPQFKSVPSDILADSRLWLPFIAGVFDGDGYVRRNGRQEILPVTTSSRELAHGIYVMLSGLGVISHWTATPQAGKSSDHQYALSVSGRTAVRLAKLLAPWCRLPGKVESLRGYIEDGNHSHRPQAATTLPGAALLAEFSDKHSGAGWYKDAATGVDLELAERDGWISKIERISPEMGHNLRNLVGHHYLEVESVTEVEPEATFDVQVDSAEHRLVVEGISSSNCMGLYHPHGDASVYDTIAGLVQPWVNNIPMFHGAGNWGSPGKEDGPAASRYCVTGDTEVSMANGTLRTLKDIAEAHGVYSDGEAVVDLKVLGALGEVVPADRIFHSGTHKVTTLTTLTGRTLTGTDNHPVLVLNTAPTKNEPAVVWKRIDELTVGDRVATLSTSGRSVDRAPWANEYQRMSSMAEQITNFSHTFEKITSLEDAGHADVYSLRIATEDHAFITNGIVSHNTEARLTPAAELMCQDIEEDSVEMADNYDASTKEPVVLPAAFPNLLVNGTSGIAVGLACNFAPHNLSEVTDALVHLLKHPDATVDDLMQYISGPDFPTGGVVVDNGGLKQAYRTGRGGIRLRAKAEIEEISARRSGIVVTELPYNIGPEVVIKKINELKTNEQIDGVGKVTNYTDLKSGLRLVIELKTGANAEQVLQKLFKLTPLEQSFNFNHRALVGSDPRLLSLLELCEHYLEHRIAVLTRRSKFRLKKAEARAHIVEGLITAHAHIDEVVKLIKASKSAKDANDKLRSTYDLSEEQAQAILEMTLRRLTGLEINALKDELAALNKKIKGLKELLESEKKLRAQVGKELQETCRKLSFDRRSEVVSAADLKHYDIEDVDDPVSVVAKPLVLAWDVDGNLFAYNEGQECERPLKALHSTTTTSDVGVVTDKGNLLSFAALGINGSAYPLEEHVTLPEGERAVGLVPRRDETGHVVMVTRGGAVKKIEVGQFAKKDGLSIMKMKTEGDSILAAFYLPADSEESLALVTSEAKMLKLDLSGIRAQGRTGGGVAGIKLPEGVTVVGAGPSSADAQLVTLTDAGSAKATPLAEYPVKGRGTAGVRCHNFKKGESKLVAAAITPAEAKAASSRAVKPVKKVAKRDASGNRVGLSGELVLGF